MNIVFIASIVNSDAGGRTFLLYGDKGFAIDPQIITPFRYVPYILLRIFSTQGFAYIQRLWTFFFLSNLCSGKNFRFLFCQHYLFWILLYNLN